MQKEKKWIPNVNLNSFFIKVYDYSVWPKCEEDSIY